MVGVRFMESAHWRLGHRHYADLASATWPLKPSPVLGPRCPPIPSTAHSKTISPMTVVSSTLVLIKELDQMARSMISRGWA